MLLAMLAVFKLEPMRDKSTLRLGFRPAGLGLRHPFSSDMYTAGSCISIDARRLPKLTLGTAELVRFIVDPSLPASTIAHQVTHVKGEALMLQTEA